MGVVFFLFLCVVKPWFIFASSRRLFPSCKIRLDNLIVYIKMRLWGIGFLQCCVLHKVPRSCHFHNFQSCYKCLSTSSFSKRCLISWTICKLLTVSIGCTVLIFFTASFSYLSEIKYSTTLTNYVISIANPCNYNEKDHRQKWFKSAINEVHYIQKFGGCNTLLLLLLYIFFI